MRTAHRLIASVALAGTVALGLTGCLPSEPFPGRPGSRVLNDSVTALRGASTFTVSGTTSGLGVPTQVNLSISGSGECTGTLSAQSGGNIEVVRTRDHTFFRGDEALVLARTQDMPEEQAARARKEMSGRWMRVETSDPSMKGLTSLCDRDGLLRDLYSIRDAEKGALTEIDGQEALSLNTMQGVFLVATKGEPFLLKATTGGSDAFDLAFTGINRPVQVDVPADKDVYDPDDID
ncbi:MULTISPECIES: hypothetical protein [Streptomyces]|uniref:Lipoprotein n=1 Tax=Streptomyces spororaveus TaxID=284039 RepID=A0ABQ3T3H1_9ACTN|nr:hypothetical protein [Streptomyces spororaveus]MCM9077197.1 hypothetical protein [Streptomyces spororaveus]GHI74924.1 hypothetical protein Sspor_04850 [Streptomyces spororaveus]